LKKIFGCATYLFGSIADEPEAINLAIEDSLYQEVVF
jgi:hypothetical protein